MVFSIFKSRKFWGRVFPVTLAMVPGILQTTGIFGCICSSEADEVLRAAAERDQTSTGGSPPTQEQDADHGAVSLELGPALCPCSQGPQVAQLTGLQQDLGHLCGSNLHRLWEGLGQLGCGHWSLCLASMGSSTFHWGPCHILPLPVARRPGRSFAPRTPLQGSLTLRTSVSTSSSPAASLKLCSALLWGISLGRPAC